jgi:predicted GNAT family N-acyltransferase
MSDLVSSLKSLRSRWALLGVEIDAYSRNSPPYEGQGIHVGRIVVAKESRGEGLGTLAMRDLTRLADKHRLRITLSPSTDFGGTSVARLRRFYGRFGFVNNTGRHKDFTISDTMYRLPR